MQNGNYLVVSEGKNLALLAKCARIIDAIFNGASMRQQIVLEGLSTRSFFNQLQLSDELMQQYVYSQQCKSEMLVDEIIDLADDPNIDPFRAKVRIEARKWYAAKMLPSKFGDRVDINVQHTVNINTALTEARGRAQLVKSYPTDAIDAQVISVTDKIAQDKTGDKPVEDDGDEINIFE